jgi:hypothetical protein
MSDLHSFVTKVLPTPKPKPAHPAQKKPGAGVIRRVNVIPAALTRKDLAAADYRLLRRFMTGHYHDTVHAATLALKSLQTTIVLLDALNDKDTRMAESGLLGEDSEALSVLVARQDNVRAALRGCMRELAAMRVLRLQELVEMEAALEREERRQRQAIKAKAKAKTAAEVHYEGSDEPGTPTIQIDPTLLAQATKTLLTDPDGINAKAASTGDSRKRASKRTVGKVKHA